MTVDLAHEADFAIGGLRVRPAVRQVEWGGKSETLEPRIMQVFVVLARRTGEVVSRDDLIRECWDGRIVGDDALNRCVSRLRKLGDEAVAFGLETIPRVGYRLKPSDRAVQNAGTADQAAAEAPPAKQATPRRGWVAGAIAAMAVAVLALGAGAAWLLVQNSDASWVENEVVPQMEALLTAGDMEGAYALAKRAQQRAPESRTIQEFWPRLSWQTSINSDPPGAKVFRRAYNAPADAEWEELGATPLENIRIPYGYSRLRFEHEGHQTLFRAIGGGGRSMTNLPDDFHGLHPTLVGSGIFKLEPLDGDYPDKVRVPGWSIGYGDRAIKFSDFFLDRTEVTNAKYKEFVDGGGYDNPAYWGEIVENGKVIPWEEAKRRFTDSTGRLSGPFTWTGGNYPKGHDNFPVTGVSWYEAAAYARFRGQRLPTAWHWDAAVASSENPWLVAAGNFNSSGPRAVGEGDAMSYVGALDMFGNAREWTDSATGDQRVIRGGGWTDPQYCAECLAPPMDRSPINGFRLAVISDPPAAEAFGQKPIPPAADFPWPEPASDARFAEFSKWFTYEQRPLDPVVEQTIDSPSWTRERITFSAPDASDRMILYLFLPKTGKPPYQVVIDWPDASALQLTTAEAWANELDFVVKSGRAVALPVLWGTFQRGDGSGLPANGSATERDRLVNMVKDTRRAVDYLQSRNDIDGKAIGLYAFSWGAVFAPLAIAQEPRIRVAVLNTGGVPLWPLMPEINPSNSVPRITVPTLMLKGLYDSIVPNRNNERMYELLGAREKKHVRDNSGHYVSREIVIRETLDWLDKYLGPASKKPP